MKKPRNMAVMVWNKHEHNRECDGIFIFVFLSKNKWTWIDIIIIRRHYSIWNGSAMIWFWLLQSADLFTLTRCVNCRCWGSWRTLHGKMVTFSNKCCNNIPRCLSSWWRWGQCPGWRGRPCTGSRHPAPPAHSTRWWEWRPRTRRRTACCWWKSACYRLPQTSPTP